ncbi:hypothetical protein ABPG74_012658 [Tetrahymena malaccensis]
MSVKIIQKQPVISPTIKQTNKLSQIDISDEKNMTLENLILKHNKLIYETIGKKPKNALDFEWTTIQTHDGATRYTIDMQDKKKFDYNPETHEIIWYKNLNIPTIRVSKKAEQIQSNGKELKRVFTKIMAVRGVRERVIQQIGLSGLLEKQFDKDSCIFNHLRFKETYFQYKRSYFSLIIVIQEQYEDQIVISEIKISTPIRVEARKKSYQDRLNTSSLLDPFLPDFIEKQYLVFKQGSKDLMPISENLEGLLDYLKAQNIRHKVFHPFFFLIKFFQATQLYYNSNIVECEKDIKPQELFLMLQKEIYKYQIKEFSGESIPFENKLLILCLNNQGKDSHMNKICEKITKFLKFLENSALYYSQATVDGLPVYFKQITFSKDDLKQGYIKAYNKLSSMKFEMVISKQNNIQSHISIQKKGQIPRDLKLDKESIDYLSNIPGPFHKAIFDLTIRNRQLYQNAQRIKVRFEDFNLFSYEIHEDSQNEVFGGPSLINELPAKISRDNQEIQKILEKKKPKHVPGSISGTTKPSSSDSNNGKGNSQSGGCEIENSDSNNNYSYSNSSLNDSQYKQQNQDEQMYEVIQDKNSQLSKEYREGEEYSSSKEQNASCKSSNTNSKKYKNHKLLLKNGKMQQRFKKMCTESSKQSFLDFQKENKFKPNQFCLPRKEEEENGDLDEEDNDDEYQMQREENNQVEKNNNNNVNLVQIERKDHNNQKIQQNLIPQQYLDNNQYQ